LSPLDISPCVVLYCDPPPPEIYTLSLHDALPISGRARTRAGPYHRPAPPVPRGRRGVRTRLPETAARPARPRADRPAAGDGRGRSEEHTSELQSRENLVCRLLLEKKKMTTTNNRK